MEEHEPNGRIVPTLSRLHGIVLWGSSAVASVAVVALIAIKWPNYTRGGYSHLLLPLFVLTPWYALLMRRQPEKRRWFYVLIALLWLIAFFAVLAILDPAN